MNSIPYFLRFAILLLSVTAASNASSDSVVVVSNSARYLAWIDDEFQGIQEAPFGSGGGCPLQDTVKSPWPVFSTLRLLRPFRLSTDSGDVMVIFSVDNDVEILVNGTSIGLVQTEHCPVEDEHTLIIPHDILRPGVNLIEVIGMDHGWETYLSLRVEQEIMP